MPLTRTLTPYDPDCEHQLETEYPKIAAIFGAVTLYAHGNLESGLVYCVKCDGRHECEHDYDDWKPAGGYDHNERLEAACKDCGYVHPCRHERRVSDHGAVLCGGPCASYLECADCGYLLNGTACGCEAVAA